MNLIEAIKANNLIQVSLLLVEGADVNEKSTHEKRKGWTALMYACELGRTEIVQALIYAQADVNILEIKDDKSALLITAEKGHLEIVRSLVSAGADVNAQQIDGDTALIWAATEGYTEIAKVLISANADPLLKDNLGWTALIWAATNGHVPIVELLMETRLNGEFGKDEDDKIALLIAVTVGYTEIARLLTQGKYDENTPGYHNAIKAAVTSGHKEIVNLLRSSRINSK